VRFAQRLVARQIARHGRAVTLQFGAAFTTEVTILATVRHFDGTPLVPGSAAQQGDREVRIAQDTYDAAGAPRALAKGDRIIIAGRTAAITESPEIRDADGAGAMIVIRLRGQ
jgi:hypothetical protein